MSMWPPFATVGDRPNTSDINALTAWYAIARPLLYQYESLVFDLLRARGYQIIVDYDQAAANPYYPIGWAVNGRVLRNSIEAGYLMQELTPVYFTPEEFAARVESAWQVQASMPATVIQIQTPVPTPYSPASPLPLPQSPSVTSPPPQTATNRTAQELSFLRRGRVVRRIPAMAVSDALGALFR